MIMKKKLVLSFLLLFVFMFILLGGTAAFAKTSAASVTTVTQKGVKVSFRYIDKKMLFNRFGNRNNPFVSYVTGPLIVIEVVVQPTVDVRIETGDAMLESEQGTSKPVSKSEISQYWGYKLRKRAGGRVSEQYSNWSPRYVMELLDANVISDTVLIRSGGKQRGLLLFEPFRPRKGTATLKLPVFDTGGNLIYQFEFDFRI
jgi:hypothetical protein